METTTEKSNTTGAQALVDLISRPNRAPVDELMKSTGWQKHTVRTVISTEKKKRGLKIKLIEDRCKLVQD